MNDIALVGHQISVARQSMGLTTAQLAQRVGVKTSTLENWENERSSPRANRLVQLAGILGVPLAWLMAGDEQPFVDYEKPDIHETASIEGKLYRAEQLVIQLSNLLIDLRTSTHRVQQEIDANTALIADTKE